MRIGIAGTGRIGSFHAATLSGVAGVDELVVADAVPEAASRLAGDLGVRAVTAVEDLFDAGLDGLVITTATPGHAPLLRASMAAGLPTFCEKPVAGTLVESLELVRLERASGVPVQVGFQRRFDVAYNRAKDAIDSGELGFVHTVRVNTHDQSPPPPAYLPTSGGLFRDCSVHDLDILRFVTGQEVVRVFAAGANKGAPFFTEAGDVDTAAAVLTLEDDTLVTLSATRYGGGGHDIRMEVMGEKGTLGVGFDDSLGVRPLEDDVAWPAGPPKWSFMERFHDAYVRELTGFVDVVAGRATSPCTVAEAVEAFRVAEACELSRAEHRVVELSEIPNVD